MKPKSKSRATFEIAAAFVLLLYLCHFVLQVSKNPLRLDEVDYYQCMENIVRLGLPIYYAGEVNIDPNRLMYLSTRYLVDQEFVFWRFKPETGVLKETFFALVDGTSRYTFGMWHPPLYIYLGSLVFRLLPLMPENSYLLRYFNLVFSIGIFIGMFVLSRELYPVKHRKVFLLASLLYAFNSLAMRGSILIDYNATIGPCAAIWFVIASLRAERKTRLSWELAISMMLMIFTGLGIAISLLFGLGMHCLLRLAIGHRRNLGQIILSVILGIAIFVVSFFAFCQMLQIPFSQPFLHNIARVQAVTGSPWSPQRFSTLWSYLLWYSKEIGFLVVITWVFLSIRTVLRGLKLTYRRLLIPFMIAVSLISHAFLAANAYGFPKYILFALPMLFLYIAGESTLLASGCSWKKATFTVILLLLILTNELNSLHWLIQPGSTLYSPGERGMLQIARVLQTTTSTDSIVLCRKDIGFFSHRKFIEWSGKLLSDVNLLQMRLSEANVQYAVSHISLLDPSANIGEFLNKEFSVEGKVEDFVLLHRKGE